MIHAKELRQITEASQSKIDAMLARIEPQLIQAAEAGNRMYVAYEEAPWESVQLHRTPKVSLVQQKLIDELQKHGYNAKIEKHGDPYTPRSIGMIDDEPMVQNHVLVVRW